jgi:quercetin dioxygenase-like cupin family protein
MALLHAQAGEVVYIRPLGEVIVQCLEGLVHLSMSGSKVELGAGQLLHLKAGQPHALEAVENSSVLLIILLHSTH